MVCKLQKKKLQITGMTFGQILDIYYIYFISST